MYADLGARPYVCVPSARNQLRTESKTQGPLALPPPPRPHPPTPPPPPPRPHLSCNGPLVHVPNVLLALALLAVGLTACVWGGV